MKKLALIIACGLCSLYFTADAQRNNRLEKGVVTIINSDTVDASRVEKAFKLNAPTGIKDNGLPRFALVGKDHMFYVGLGAQFLGEAAFDFGDEMSSLVLFTPSALTPSTAGNRSSLGFGWESSSVYMNMVALPGDANQIGIFFKGNFMGEGNSFNCYHFYARYRGLTVGYTTGVFSDGAAEPMTIDFEGPNAYPYLTLFNASWTQKFSSHISGAIGIDAPTASMTTGTTTAVVNQRIPAIPVYLQYEYNGGNNHVRLSGLARPLQYRNSVNNSNSTMVGLGVQISGMTTVVGPLSLNYNAVYGRGISNYLQDDNGLGVDAVNLTEEGKMDMVNSFGVTGGLSYTFSPKVSSNVTYSHLLNMLPDQAATQESQYRYGDYVAANVVYTVNKFVSAGIEYDYGHRKDFSGNSLHANRLQVQFAMTF